MRACVSLSTRAGAMGRRPFAHKFVDSDPMLNHTGAMNYSEWDTKYDHDFAGAQVRAPMMAPNSRARFIRNT